MDSITNIHLIIQLCGIIRAFQYWLDWLTMSKAFLQGRWPIYVGKLKLTLHTLQIVLSNFASLFLTSQQPAIASRGSHSQPDVCTENLSEDLSKAVVLPTDVGGSQVAQKSKMRHEVIKKEITLGYKSEIKFQLEHFTR